MIIDLSKGFILCTSFATFGKTLHPKEARLPPRLMKNSSNCNNYVLGHSQIRRGLGGVAQEMDRKVTPANDAGIAG
jgi:hypothetical protein